MGQQQSGAAGGAGASSSSGAPNVSYTSTQANGTGTQTQARKGPQTPVILNIYEPSKPTTTMPGFGIYHTGIEFSGTEYSFAGGPDAGSGTGVMSQVPRAMPADGQWKFKTAIELGTVTVGHGEFDKVLNELRNAFPANTYDLVHRNCNHFTTAVAKRLGVYAKYPSYVNRAASWGAVFVAPPKNLQPIAEPVQAVSVFKSTTGYRMDGGAPVVPKGQKAASSSSAAAAKPEQKKPETSEKKSQGRKNPWADPSFIPPQMRKDPVVNTGKIDA